MGFQSMFNLLVSGKELVYGHTAALLCGMHEHGGNLPQSTAHAERVSSSLARFNHRMADGFWSSFRIF